MQAADELAEHDVVLDVAHAVIGVVGGGDVVHGQKRPGQDLHAEDEERGAPERIEPAGGPFRLGDMALEKRLPDRGKAQPLLKPARQAHEADLAASGRIRRRPATTLAG